MASYSDGLEHESAAKRIKLDLSESDISASCVDNEFSSFSTQNKPSAGNSEGSNLDCDSGCEASTMESMPPSLDQSFGHTAAFNESTQESDNDGDYDDDEEDDNASTVTCLSGLSDLSGQEWKPSSTRISWVQKQIHSGADPRLLLADLGVEIDQIPKYFDDTTLWRCIIDMLEKPPKREKLSSVNTIDDVVRLMKNANNIIVLTGAGVSVSCGIPDFRSRDGIYSRLAVDFPDLPNPQAMFDINYFNQDPRPFFKFARDIYPGKFQPSPCHRFIKMLEKQKKLLRNYTQNIDTLEKVADITRVIECHGSFATATCTKCGHKVTAENIKETVLAQKIPVCEKCRPDIGSSISIADLNETEPSQLRDLVAAGIMKPDIVFFGEGLPDSFHEAMSEDKNKCDLLVVIGSSLKVRPVALIPSSLPAHVPQVLINREPLSHCHFDVELLGDCDVIINHLCNLLGENWKDSVYNPPPLRETLNLLPMQACETPEFNFHAKSFMGEPSSSAVKERHMSVDSARDSGIGDNSNFTDVDTLKDLEDVEPKRIQSHDRHSFLTNCDEENSADENNFAKRNETSCSESTKGTEELPISFSDILDKDRGVNGENDDDDCVDEYGSGKERRCFTERLPQNSYYLIRPSRYVFPGAELFFDSDENCSYLDNVSSDSDSSKDPDEDSENIQDVCA